MYARFFRWASDRVDENGIVAFISNRSFIESRTFDGFRKVVGREFNEIHIVDLGGDVRANPKLSGTKHNVFGIQTGVAISFLVKRRKTQGCRIFYARRPELETAEEKLSFLGDAKLPRVDFDEIQPDAKHNWLNLTQNDFESLMPIASKETKAAKKPSQERAIFKLHSLGIVTSRDEWVYDESPDLLLHKAKLFVAVYEQERERWKQSAKVGGTGDFVSREIKWTSELENHLFRGTRLTVHEERRRLAMYRPFCRRWTYYDSVITHRLYQQDSIFPVVGEWSNLSIVYTQPGSQKAFTTCAVSSLPDLHFVGAAAGTECLPLYRYEYGHRVDNITDWALDQFRKHYSGSVAAGVARRGGLRRRGAAAASTDGGLQRQDPGSNQPDGIVSITKEEIFHYVYGVLHDPVYRDKYALNLKREFPRIPFYPDFHNWAAWGKELMELHIGYETVEPWKLTRTDTADDGHTPKAMLKADKENGRILLDSHTTLSGIPPEAWTYKLGNRSALEWILDQYKEKKPKDPTIREKFNTYRFADYKEKVIDLLQRVTTVSVRTQAITTEIRTAAR